ncbi:MAG: zinc-binding dehydrogenase [Actinobacteria bacterium]|nr:zinc-binding dehydrogenase [Actinomycetota bacterium]MCL6105467.1 zinc-binding dehydrogenase [Actinomycetota bacterium]
MRAAVIKQINTVPEVEEVDKPVLNDTDTNRDNTRVLVAVEAAPLNPLDLLIASGKFYTGAPNVPYTPGSEGIGKVIEVSKSIEGSERLLGKRVCFEPRSGYSSSGALAEFAVADQSTLLDVLDNVTSTEAASVGISGLAAWLPLAWRAKLKPGETVLVLGATGAVGQVAIQASRILGAGRVVATTRSQKHVEMLKSLGADEVVVIGNSTNSKDSADPKDLAKQFKEAAKGEIDVTVDPLWGKIAVGAALASAPGARLVQMGQSYSPDVQLESGILRGRMLSILGYTNMLVPHEVLKEAYKTLLEHLSAGRIIMHTKTYPLEEIAQAWQSQAGVPHKKIVVTVS